MMILVSFQKQVSHYLHISLTTESHTNLSFPRKRNFEMSKTTDLVELDQQVDFERGSNTQEM